MFAGKSSSLCSATSQGSGHGGIGSSLAEARKQLLFAESSGGHGQEEREQGTEGFNENTVAQDPTLLQQRGRASVITFRGLGGVLYGVAAILLVRLGLDLATLNCDFRNYELLQTFTQQRNLLPQVYLYGNLATLGLAAYSCHLLFQRKRLFIPVSAALFWCDALGVLLYRHYLLQLAPLADDPLALSRFQHEPLYAAAFALVYSVYVATSRRVRNTFVRR